MNPENLVLPSLTEDKKKKPMYRCVECGGTNVEHAMWVNLNTDEVGDVFGSWCYGDNSFCQDCDGPTDIDSAEDDDIEEKKGDTVARYEIENEKFKCVFGADQAIGNYVQVWLRPPGQEEHAVVAMDKRGMRLRGREWQNVDNIRDVLAPLPISAVQFLYNIKARYDYARDLGNDSPSIDSETVAILLAKLGFPNLGQQVSKVLD